MSTNRFPSPWRSLLVAFAAAAARRGPDRRASLVRIEALDVENYKVFTF